MKITTFALALALVPATTLHAQDTGSGTCDRIAADWKQAVPDSQALIHYMKHTSYFVAKLKTDADLVKLDEKRRVLTKEATANGCSPELAMTMKVDVKNVRSILKHNRGGLF